MENGSWSPKKPHLNFHRLRIWPQYCNIIVIGVDCANLKWLTQWCKNTMQFAMQCKLYFWPFLLFLLLQSIDVDNSQQSSNDVDYSGVNHCKLQLLATAKFPKWKCNRTKVLRQRRTVTTLWTQEQLTSMRFPKGISNMSSKIKTIFPILDNASTKFYIGKAYAYCVYVHHLQV